MNNTNSGSGNNYNAEDRNKKGRFESNGNAHVAASSSKMTTSGAHIQKFNSFHLGLELEDIDESSVSLSDDQEMNGYDSIEDSHVINDLEGDDDFDADLSELYRSIPSRNRSSSVKN